MTRIKNLHLKMFPLKELNNNKNEAIGEDIISKSGVNEW